MQHRKILIYSGTTEGKQLAYTLARNQVNCDVAVATEYGTMVMDKSPYINILEGRLDTEQMRELYEKENYLAVIDATHPFATVVTANIKSSLVGSSIPYYRLLRRQTSRGEEEGMTIYSGLTDCVEALNGTEGNILLTTGSKELAAFAKEPSILKRLIVRVLPGLESIKACYDVGLEGKQIIGMQGPFSKEMNLAQIREYDICHLVTKESGVTGGADSKLEAAHEAGIYCHVIARPDELQTSEGMTHSQVINRLSELLGIKLCVAGEIEVTLAGVGMGDMATMTHEVAAAISKADYIFGAKRLVNNIQSRAAKYDYYLAKDIIPVLEEAREYKEDIKAVVLFSGDSGFYSGCKKMYKELVNRDNYNVKVLPGLSTIAVMAARLGIDWQDAYIMSAHGVNGSEWEGRFVNSVANNSKTFILTSGPADVRRIGELLLGCQPDMSSGRTILGKNEEIIGNLPKKEAICGENASNQEAVGKNKEIIGKLLKKCIFFSYNLSYEDEEVRKVTAEECLKIEKEGLYAIFVTEEQ